MWFLGGTHPDFFYEGLEDFEPSDDPYQWWRVEAHRKLSARALHSLPPKDANQYHRSLLPRKRVYLKATADVFYIPQRFAADVRRLVPHFVRHNVFSEVIFFFFFFSC